MVGPPIDHSESDRNLSLSASLPVGPSDSVYPPYSPRPDKMTPVCPCLLCLSTRSKEGGAWIKGKIGQDSLEACVDTGCTFTTVNEKFVRGKEKFSTRVNTICANGQTAVLDQYTFFILHLTPEFSVELQALVAPDQDGAPDLLIGRDCLSRLNAVISLQDSVLDISGSMFRLYPDIASCSKSDPFVFPSLPLSCADNFTLPPGSFLPILVSFEGPVCTRLYSAIPFSSSIVILSPFFDLSSFDSGGATFQVFVHNQGSKSLDLDLKFPLGVLKPVISSSDAPSVSPLNIDPIIVDSNPHLGANLYISHITSQNDNLEIPRDSFFTELNDNAAAQEAFPFADVFEADASYSTGCTLIPRKLSDEELLEWNSAVAKREGSWREDDCKKLMSLFTLPVDNFPPVIIDEFHEIINERCSIFGSDLSDLKVGLVDYLAHLELKDPTKIMYTPPRNLNLLLSAATARYARILMEARIAEHSFSPHAANSFCVAKKEKLPQSLRELECMDNATFLSTYRIVHAFIKLNDNLKTSSHTVASLRQSVLNSRPNYLYSSVDLLQSYFQIVLEPKSRDLLAFHVPGLNALLRLCRPAMGCATSAQLLAGFLFRFKEVHDLDSLETYHDDLTIGSPSWDISDMKDYELPSQFSPGEIVVPNVNHGLNIIQALRLHLKELDKFFFACQSANVVLNPKKCSFFSKVLNKLGFQISPLGISVPDSVRSSILKLRQED